MSGALRSKAMAMAVKRRVHREAVDVATPSMRFLASIPERIMLCLALTHFECNDHFRSYSSNEIPLISQPEMNLCGASLASVWSVNWPRRSDQDEYPLKASPSMRSEGFIGCGDLFLIRIDLGIFFPGHANSMAVLSFFVPNRDHRNRQS